MATDDTSPPLSEEDRARIAGMVLLESIAPMREAMAGVRAQFEAGGYTPDEARLITVALYLDGMLGNAARHWSFLTNTPIPTPAPPTGGDPS